jgi:uncharacterized membrane protein
MNYKCVYKSCLFQEYDGEWFSIINYQILFSLFSKCYFQNPSYYLFDASKPLGLIEILFENMV